MMRTQVVKIGGSLFDLADLPKRIGQWRDQQENARQVFIIGGGALVDQVRIFERRFGLPEKTSHDLSCQLMGITARLATAWLPNVPVVSEVGFAGRSDQSLIFDSSRWLLEDDPTEASWDATSDSIAAALAQQIGASELVLFKSMSIEHGVSIVDASSRGWVDLCLARYSQDIPKVSIVNLRDDAYAQFELTK